MFQTLNRLGILSVGRRPEWTKQATYTGAPAGAAAGVPLAGAVKTPIYIALRKRAARREVTIGIGFDAATTYEITIDGHQVDTVGDSDQATTLQAIADDINADPDAGTVVTASVDGDQVILHGIGEEDYTVEVAATDGTGEIAIESADATDASARVWLLPGGAGDTPPAWVQAREGVFEGLDWRGITERLSTAGYARLYVEVFDADGDVAVAVGPGGME